MPEPQDAGAAARVDTSKPHPARMYDWMLGGKDNYPVDEELGRQMVALEPQLPLMARMNRAFMRRATRWLATRGIDQFLDVGSGIPTEPNLHQVVQSVRPEARVVYCDRDPIVMAHAEALLHGTPEGALDFALVDAHDTEAVLALAAKTLDLSRPVALSLVALLHFIRDEDGAHALVTALKDALAPGSHLVMSHFTADFHAPEDVARASGTYRAKGLTAALRTRAEFTRFLDGFETVGPGVVLAEEWHPELGERVPGQDGRVSSTYAAVARKA
ncbi:SAM-dependent methyltransferase [Streptomyces sp. NEAU-H3]|uniref:SAM-dependent methyltransferase n=1 Tax=Streptomyces sp. NEAU-H3 TaxID=2720636 RepID=UPI00143AA5A6|nr:SAM-dependent methyltransferase [Streptomyces sp. NEAU-H3]NJA55566.1 SAM-dependent methyltransferase [Streptomyces sp. NEAU-H3]